jgi:ABC-type thiamin/hydroxymethylpyrimidine transport system permease subunit
MFQVFNPTFLYKGAWGRKKGPRGDVAAFYRPRNSINEGWFLARRRLFTSRELSLIIVLSALGGGVSVPLGYTGSALNALPFMPFGTPQILSGVHVLWILLAGGLVPRVGASALTGVLKGMVELTFFSQHNIVVLLISSAEGLVMEAGLLLLGRKGPAAYVAGGLSSASNVLVLQLTFLRGLPIPVSAYMYAASFISGALFAGYLGVRALKIAESLGLAPSLGVEDVE